jgi:transporter family protein
MPWYFYAILAPAIWALVNHIDKYIVSQYFSDIIPGPFVIFTSITAFFGLVLISIFVPIHSNISLTQIIFVIASGALLVGAYIPYVYALKEDEASFVAPLFQLIFVFTYILGFIFLGESLSFFKILASLLVIGGSLILSFDTDAKLGKLKTKTLGRMTLASLLISLNMLIFKVVGLETSFWVTTFWEYVGAFLFGLFLFVFIKNYRKVFLSIFETKPLSVTSWNIFNEVLNLIARLAANFSSLLAPLAIISLANGFQPVFIIFYGTVLPLFFKKMDKEKFYGKYLTQKIIAISVMAIGTYVLFK